MRPHVKLAPAFCLLLASCLTLPALAQGLGVSPAEVKLENLSPGEKAEFQLTIYNKDSTTHAFLLSTFQPGEGERRDGRDEFPDASWISFSPQQIEVPGRSEAKVRVTVSVPGDEKWAGKDWETWLAVSSQSSDFLAVQLYVRLLVSTGSTTIDQRPGAMVPAAIFLSLALACGTFYFFRLRRRTQSG